MSIEIILPDNSTKVFDHEPTVLEVAESISPGLAKATLGAQVDGSKEVIDLRSRLKTGSRLKILTSRDPDGLEVVRHSCAHIMAQAVQAIWPEVKVTIGPVIETGFYYDFEKAEPFSEDDLAKIETKMKEIIKAKLPVTREEWDSQDALARFKDLKEDYKIELIEDIAEPTVGVYKNGDQWLDLCRGPHVQNTGDIKAFKLMSVAGAYWRGDENRQKLQRIYGTAFFDKKELKRYLSDLEEAKKRDHRKLGKELGLFHFHSLSPGGPFFTGKGAHIYNQLTTFLRELYHRDGYQEVVTPQIFDVDLYHQSGHYENYRENMYFTKTDERDFSVKPMNCPGHCVLYSMEHHSYRDLPLKFADFGRLHRYERSGTMHGLTRVRTFCQDDGHIFCTVDQMFDEIKGYMSLLNEVYRTLGMSNYKVYLSTRPEKRLGSDEIWDRSEEALAKALQSLDIPYEVNEGDGAFYGPKIDIMFVDAIRRPWQLGTLQCDYNLPERFQLKYVGEDNAEHRPVILHRAVLGSLERFIGLYLEHTAGHLPTWLSPNPVQILNVTDRQAEYCESLEKEIRDKGFRVHFDRRAEKLGYKIREAQLQKTPYMLIIGDKEVEKEMVSVRLRNGDTVNDLTRAEFMKVLSEDIRQRKLTSPLLKENSHLEVED